MAKSIPNFQLPAENQREFCLLFYFADVTFKSEEESDMLDFSIKLNYRKKKKIA